MYLRQRHFPRLKAVSIFEREYFVTPPEPPSFAKRVFHNFVKFATGLRN
jgi:hypothetical protein